MKNTVKHSAFLLFYFGLLSSCNWTFSEIRYFEGTFEKALEHHIQKKKPLLIQITTPQCSACETMEQGILSSPQAKRYLNNNYVIYKYDVAIISNTYLNRLIYQYTFPSWILIDKDGYIKSIIAGIKAPVVFMNYLEFIQGDLHGDYSQIGGSSLTSPNEDLYQLLNLTHQAWKHYQQGEYEDSYKQATKSIEIEPYFFNLYLAAKTAQKTDQGTEAKLFAQEALAIDNAKSHFLYNELFAELEYLLKNDFLDTAKQDYPILTLAETEHNFGQLQRNEKASYSFRFKNTGNKPLFLSKVKSSCGCTVPAWTKKPIMPGDEGEVTVVYDSSKPGRFSKVLLLFSNAKIGTTKIVIKGSVL